MYCKSSFEVDLESELPEPKVMATDGSPLPPNNRQSHGDFLAYWVAIGNQSDPPAPPPIQP